MKLIKQYHTGSMNQFLKDYTFKDKKVLVMGCNTGIECHLIETQGANEVIGIDLDEKVGCDYPSKNISYYKESATDLSIFNDNTFDVVYSVATFEHIFDINSSYKEAIRITKKGGIIFIISSPLWQSPYGHHYGKLLNDLQWIHLIEDQNSIYNILNKDGISTYNGIKIKEILRYIFSPKFFNHYPGSYYVNTCGNMKNCKIIKNNLSIISIRPKDFKYGKKCLEYGFSENDLRGVNHLFCAVKA